jgi:hypothetical protein
VGRHVVSCDTGLWQLVVKDHAARSVGEREGTVDPIK